MLDSLPSTAVAVNRLPSPFLVECDRFLKEIEKEIGKGKLTSAELDEEEQSYERLVRWHRDIARRTMFQTGLSPTAERRLRNVRQL
jgi:hypothetical protein